VDSLGQGSPTFPLIVFHKPLDHVYAHCPGFALDRVSRLQSHSTDNQMTRPQIICERVHKTYAMCVCVCTNVCRQEWYKSAWQREVGVSPCQGGPAVDFALPGETQGLRTQVWYSLATLWTFGPHLKFNGLESEFVY